jgi:LuxR family maltose regulon positive regulatory protein
LLQACDLCARIGNQYALLTAQLFLARVFASRGKLHQAFDVDEGLIKANGQIPILCLAHYDLATIHHEWNNLQKAGEHFEQGFALSQRSNNMEFQQAGHLLRAILMHALGEDAEAISAHAKAEALARDFPAVIRSRVAAFGVQMALARDDAQMLARWEPQLDAEVDAHLFYRFMGLTRPRLLLAQGKKEEAAEVLRVIYETASQPGWGYGMLVVRILQSLAAKNKNDAMQFISDALRMGKPEIFIRSFVDAGSGIVPVLQEAARRGIEAEYAGRILNAMGAGRSSVARVQAGLVEPLSEREIEVLRLVTAGMSNRAIAGKLVISPGTAKTHIHNLCGKLGARNRTEAAMKAKELGLV